MKKRISNLILLSVFFGGILNCDEYENDDIEYNRFGSINSINRYNLIMQNYNNRTLNGFYDSLYSMANMATITRDINIVTFYRNKHQEKLNKHMLKASLFSSKLKPFLGYFLIVASVGALAFSFNKIKNFIDKGIIRDMSDIEDIFAKKRGSGLRTFLLFSTGLLTSASAASASELLFEEIQDNNDEIRNEIININYNNQLIDELDRIKSSIQ